MPYTIKNFLDDLKDISITYPSVKISPNYSLEEGLIRADGRADVRASNENSFTIVRIIGFPHAGTQKDATSVPVSEFISQLQPLCAKNPNAMIASCKGGTSIEWESVKMEPVIKSSCSPITKRMNQLLGILDEWKSSPSEKSVDSLCNFLTKKEVDLSATFTIFNISSGPNIRSADQCVVFLRDPRYFLDNTCPNEFINDIFNKVDMGRWIFYVCKTDFQKYGSMIRSGGLTKENIHDMMKPAPCKETIEATIDGDKMTITRYLVDENGNKKKEGCEEVYTNRIISQTIMYKDNKREGETVFYDEKGSKEMVESYKDDKLHGECTSYYDNGAISSKADWENGRLHGNCINYHDNGNISIVIEYINGMQDGTEQCFDETGKLKSKIHWKSDVKSGPYTIRSKDGELEEGIYINNHQFKKDEKANGYVSVEGLMIQKFNDIFILMGTDKGNPSDEQLCFARSLGIRCLNAY